MIAFDNEPESVAATRENALVNGVELEVREADLRAATCRSRRSRERGTGSAVVLCQPARGLLLELAAVLEQAPSHLIAWGLLEGEVDEVARRSRSPGDERSPASRLGGWEALWLGGPQEP